MNPGLQSESPGRASARGDGASEIAAELLWSAARKGEIGVAVVRAVVGAAVAFCWPIIHWDHLVELVPRTLAALAVGWLTLLWSGYVFYRLRHARPTYFLMLTSITLDAVLLNGMLWFYIEFPGATHDSIVEVHGSALVYLAIITAGARISTLAAVWGAAVNSVLFGGLVILSTTQVNNWTTIGPIEWITVAIGLVGSTILSVAVAARTRELVFLSALETKSAERAISKLGAYVSNEVASELLKQDELKLGGTLQPVAVLFSDLRGFTRYSEDLEPTELVQQLNEYLDAMVAAINKHEGVVDKYMGDGIMAVFGAPITRSDDALRSIRAAEEMMAQLDVLNVSRQQRGLPALQQGIGIHYGDVVAGNVGTSDRAAYTVIGDTVNLASRLESASKSEEAVVLISESAMLACGDAIALDFVSEIEVPGRQQAVRIYTLPST